MVAPATGNLPHSGRNAAARGGKTAQHRHFRWNGKCLAEARTAMSMSQTRRGSGEPVNCSIKGGKV